MYTFLIGIAILVVGYFTWGKIAEKIFSPDNRLTPAIAERDNTDKMPLPNKRNMLIQLLNIAGIGPIVGVALGEYCLARLSLLSCQSEMFSAALTMLQ